MPVNKNHPHMLTPEGSFKMQQTQLSGHTGTKSNEVILQLNTELPSTP